MRTCVGSAATDEIVHPLPDWVTETVGEDVSTRAPRTTRPGLKRRDAMAAEVERRISSSASVGARGDEMLGSGAARAIASITRGMIRRVTAPKGDCRLRR